MFMIVAFLMLAIGLTPAINSTSRVEAEFTYVLDGDLYSLRLTRDSWQTENLTKDFSPYAGLPVWSPDGRHLAFMASDNDGSNSLYV